jgi:hypothetical protein
MKDFGALTIGTIIGIPLAAWKAYVAIILWTWFVTPSTGWQPPALWTTAGLFILIALTHNHNVKTKADDYGDDSTGMLIYGTALGLIVPAFALLGGFIFKTLGG